MRSFFLTVLVGSLAACGSPSLDGDSDHVKTWAVTGSAVGVFANVYDPIAFADGHHTFADPACPVTGDDGTTAVITGGCTDSTGEPWAGSARIVRAGGDRTVTLDGYGHGAGAAHTTGTARFRPTTGATQSFDASLRVVGGATTTIDYTGTITGTYGAATTFDGNGTISRDGLVKPTGTVTTATHAEVFDTTTCSGEPLSGSTTVTADGHTAVVTYDGATACDAMHTAHWTYDGVDQGTVTGIGCSTVPGLSGSAWPAAALGAVALLAAVRRRRG